MCESVGNIIFLVDSVGINLMNMTLPSFRCHIRDYFFHKNNEIE